jgi:ribosomal protein S27AE
MTQTCPLCGKTVYLARNADPDSLAWRFYFCRETPESCRATFMIQHDNECINNVYVESAHEANTVNG